MSEKTFDLALGGSFVCALFLGLWLGDVGGIRGTVRALGSGLGDLVVRAVRLALVLGLAGGLIYGIVRIVRLAWGSP